MPPGVSHLGRLRIVPPLLAIYEEFVLVTTGGKLHLENPEVPGLPLQWMRRGIPPIEVARHCYRGGAAMLKRELHQWHRPLLSRPERGPALPRDSPEGRSLLGTGTVRSAIPLPSDIHLRELAGAHDENIRAQSLDLPQDIPLRPSLTASMTMTAVTPTTMPRIARSPRTLGAFHGPERDSKPLAHTQGYRSARARSGWHVMAIGPPNPSTPPERVSR